MDKQYHILVVDDEERIRRLLRMYLEREGYKITEAENGEEALEKAFQFDYDLILLDFMLPGMDGLDVCAEIRRKKAYAHYYADCAWRREQSSGRV